MSRNGKDQGEYVRLSAQIFDNTVWHAVILSTPDGVARTIKPFERLLIDDINCDTAGQGPVWLSDSKYHAIGSLFGGGPTTGGVDVYAVFDDPTQYSNAAANTPVGPQGPTNSPNAPDGMPMQLGATPVILISGASQGQQVYLVGTGRIVAVTQPGRQTWREKLTPQGNF